MVRYHISRRSSDLYVRYGRAYFRRDHIWIVHRKKRVESISGRCENPYTPAQIVSMAYENIEKCGLYQDDCREWSWKPRLKKTWINFKDHFAREFKETRRSSRTSKTKGYSANVQSAQANAALFTKMQQDHTLALANIATATQDDRTLVTLLTKTISELSTQVNTLTAKLATARYENNRLKIGTSFTTSQARTSCVQWSDSIWSKSDPGPQCLFKEQTQIRP